MLHTTPTWDSTSCDPGIPAASWVIWTLTVIAAAVFITFALRSRSAELNATNKKDRRRHEASAELLMFGFIVSVVAGVVAGFIVSTNVGFDKAKAAGAAHRAEIAEWLDSDYGVTVNADQLWKDHGVIEATATLDGHPAVIRLLPTPDGHIAAFTSGDKPLEKATR